LSRRERKGERGREGKREREGGRERGGRERGGRGREGEMGEREREELKRGKGGSCICGSRRCRRIDENESADVMSRRIYIGKWVSAIERAPLRPFLPYGPFNESIRNRENERDVSSYVRIENISPNIAKI